MNAKQIQTYLISNYGEIRHDAEQMAKAIEQTANEHEINKRALFLMIVENEPIISQFNPPTHSYGFQTRYGREIINTFNDYYFNSDNQSEENEPLLISKLRKVN